MPWDYEGYPPSYKDQPAKLRNKAIEIANELLLQGAEGRIAIAAGLKRAKDYFADEEKKKRAENMMSYDVKRDTMKDDGMPVDRKR
jgi:uncharacterized protein YdaT